MLCTIGVIQVVKAQDIAQALNTDYKNTKQVDVKCSTGKYSDSKKSGNLKYAKEKCSIEQEDMKENLKQQKEDYRSVK